MTQMIEIKNGDMVRLAKVVNTNTYRLDKRIDDMESCIGNIVISNKKMTKEINATTKAFIASGICTAFTLFFLTKRIDSLDKKIKKLEDEKIYNDYMRDEAENDCLK